MPFKKRPSDPPMPNDELPEMQAQQETESIASDAELWGRLFVTNLELEYANLAAELPRDAMSSDFHRAMILAIERVFHESGADRESIVRLWQENARRFMHVDEDTAWSGEKNARRLNLIDKRIQQTITEEESLELRWLTEQMRACCDHEETVPLEGARELHRRLLDIDDV